MLVPLGRALTWRLHTKFHKFGWNTFPNNARLNNRTDLNLGEIVYTPIIFHFSVSWVNSLDGYDFYFLWRDTADQPYCYSSKSKYGFLSQQRGRQTHNMYRLCHFWAGLSPAVYILPLYTPTSGHSWLRVALFHETLAERHHNIILWVASVNTMFNPHVFSVDKRVYILKRKRFVIRRLSKLRNIILLKA